MRTISVINQKGGVAKTTTASAIGAGLLLRGQRVLFVDLDAQGNLGYSLRAEASDRNALTVLQRPKTAESAIQHLAQGDIIPSTPNMAGADLAITQTGKEYRLREALEGIQGKYDYCVIDTPPALGIATINALTASQGIVIPCQADIYSIQGLAQLSSTIDAVRKYCNPQLQILGILLTRYNKRSIIRRDVAETLAEVAQHLNTKLFDTRIRECTALVEAQARRQSIYQYSPRSNATADYKALVDEILNENGKEAN